MKYFKLSTQTIIDTVNPVSTDKLQEKGLLPVEIQQVAVKSAEEVKQEEVIDWDKYIIKKYTFVPEVSLETLKERKLFELKAFTEDKFPAVHRQLNVALQIYDENRSKLVKEEVIKWRNYYNTKEDEINSCTSIEEINKILVSLKEEE